jgi:hypothetical protein
LAQNSEFKNELNQIRAEQLADIRGNLRKLAKKAVSVIDQLLSNPESNEAVRLKAAERVLEFIGVLNHSSKQPVLQTRVDSEPIFDQEERWLRIVEFMRSTLK